jgi:hypothetical protein
VAATRDGPREAGLRDTCGLYVDHFTLAGGNGGVSH